MPCFSHQFWIIIHSLSLESLMIVFWRCYSRSFDFWWCFLLLFAASVLEYDWQLPHRSETWGGSGPAARRRGRGGGVCGAADIRLRGQVLREGLNWHGTTPRCDGNLCLSGTLAAFTLHTVHILYYCHIDDSFLQTHFLFTGTMFRLIGFYTMENHSIGVCFFLSASFSS